jgi:glycosyltransferase involved in cell wall biosynthesis
VVVDTIRHLRRQVPAPLEILVVDQTQDHPVEVARDLEALTRDGAIAWHRLAEPSIPAAMNHGLLAAKGDCVLFLDDDIEPCASLVQRHLDAQAEASLVAGQVLQPGQETEPLAAGEAFRFNSPSPAWIKEFMGGNFSVNRARALALGGFDQNFVGAAYRFEAEFAHRFVQAVGLIRYEPAAAIRHLAVSTGGTRAHGHHLTTIRPGHSVGAYYYLLKTRKPGWFGEALWRPIRAVRTRHHLRRPWWIPATLLAELRGLLLARRLLRSGPRLIDLGSGSGGA